MKNSCKCGHNFDEHGWAGCLTTVENDKFCRCKITPSKFVEEARAEARKWYRRALKAEDDCEFQRQITIERYSEIAAIKAQLAAANAEIKRLKYPPQPHDVDDYYAEEVAYD